MVLPGNPSVEIQMAETLNVIFYSRLIGNQTSNLTNELTKPSELSPKPKRFLCVCVVESRDGESAGLLRSLVYDANCRETGWEVGVGTQGCLKGAGSPWWRINSSQRSKTPRRFDGTGEFYSLPFKDNHTSF